MIFAEWEKLGRKNILFLTFICLLLACWFLSESLYLTPQDKAYRSGISCNKELEERYSRLREKWVNREKQAGAKGNSVLFQNTLMERRRLQDEQAAYKTLLENIAEIHPDYRWQGILASPFPFILQILLAFFLCERLFLRERGNGFISLIRSSACRPVKRFVLRAVFLCFLFIFLSLITYLFPLLIETVMRGPLNNIKAQALPALMDLDRNMSKNELFSLLFWTRSMASLGFALSFTFVNIFARNVLLSAFLLFLYGSASFILLRSISLNSRYLIWRYLNPAWIFFFFSELPQNVRLCMFDSVIPSEILAFAFWIGMDILLLWGIFCCYEKDPLHKKRRFFRALVYSRKSFYKASDCTQAAKRCKKLLPRMGEGRRIAFSASMICFIIFFIAVFAYQSMSYTHLASPQEKSLESLYAEYGGRIVGERKARLEKIDREYDSRQDEIEALRAKQETEKDMTKREEIFQEIEALVDQSLPSADFYPILERYRQLKNKGGEYLVYERPYQLLLGLENSSLQAQDYLLYTAALVLILLIAFSPDFESSYLELYRCLSGGREKFIRSKLHILAAIIVFLNAVIFLSRLYKLRRVFPLQTLAPHLINISDHLTLPISTGCALILQALFSCLLGYTFSLFILLTFFQRNRLMSLAFGFILMLSPFLLYRLGATHISLFSLLCGSSLEEPKRAGIMLALLLLIMILLRCWLIISWREGGVKLLNKNV